MPDNNKTKDTEKSRWEVPFGLVLVFLLMSSVVVLSGYIYYNSYKKSLYNNAKKELTSVCDLKVSQVLQWRKERLADARYIFNNILIADKIDAFLEDPQHQAGRKDILSWLTQTRDTYHYKEVGVLDRNGNLILTTDKDIHQDEDHIKTAKRSFEKKEVIIGDLHKHQRTGEIDFGLYIPFLISKENVKDAIGGIMLIADPDNFLFPLIQTWPVPSDTAESLLIRVEGNDVLFLNELRHKKDTALTLRIPISNPNLPAAMAVRGIEGVVEGLDYRNVPVIADIKKIPDTDWYFVSKIDQEEVYQPAERILLLIVAFVIFGILAAVLGIGLFWRNQRAVYYKGLYKAEEKLRESEKIFESFMEHSPIYVFFKDENIRSIRLSRNFETMLKRPLDEILGKSMDELFPSVLAQSMVEDDKRILNEGKILNIEEELNGRFYHTIKFPIIIGDKARYLAGYTIDITERKKAEDALKLNKDRLEALLKLTLMSVGLEKEITDFALEEAVRLTSSKGGYLHFFNEDEQTIQLHSWSKDVLRTCTAAKDEHYPLDKAGVWADSVRFKRAVIHNDYQDLTERKGLPEGHFRLFRHLGVPIFEKERIVGVMGVGNKEEPYNEEDAIQVSLFMNSMWGILKQRRTEAEREKLILELREALAKVKTLSGMLPICATCKKVRDDKGYWKQVESYVSEHTEAVFSHGICPECENKAYEELKELLRKTKMTPESGRQNENGPAL